MASLVVNGKTVTLQSGPDTPLLYVLRDELQLNGAKYGCGLGQCGACTVMIGDRAVLSCITPLAMVEGKSVTTLEGLGTLDQPGPLQRAFIDEQAAQCGFCIPGMIMSAAALLKRHPAPTDAQMREALQQNLCRCGTQMRVLRAIRRAVKA